MIKTVVFVAVVLLATAANARDLAVEKTTLSGMGLAGMRSLDDAAGNAVRGKYTFAGVSGSSSANWFGQSSTNSYQAGSSWIGRSAGATGRTFSFTGTFQFSRR